MVRLKSKDNKAILYPTKLDHPSILIQLFAKNVCGELEDHVLIGSNLSEQEVQSTRTLLFKMYIKLHWMHVKIKI